MPVEGFNIEEFTDAEFDQHLPNTGAIQRAFDEGKLGTLDLFEELKEDPADHMKENLSVTQNQSENKNDDVWEVSYFGSHPDSLSPAAILGDCSLKSIAERIGKTSRTSNQRKAVYYGMSALTGACVGDIGDAISIYELMLKKAETTFPISAKI